MCVLDVPAIRLDCGAPSVPIDVSIPFRHGDFAIDTLHLTFVFFCCSADMGLIRRLNATWTVCWMWCYVCYTSCECSVACVRVCVVIIISVLIFRCFPSSALSYPFMMEYRAL